MGGWKNLVRTFFKATMTKPCLLCLGTTNKILLLSHYKEHSFVMLLFNKPFPRILKMSLNILKFPRKFTITIMINSSLIYPEFLSHLSKNHNKVDVSKCRKDRIVDI